VSDDAQLIDQALAGHSEAFGQLVARYQDRLYNSLVHVVGSRDLAYDAIQDAFVQAFVKLHTFERASAFYTWLYRIAFNIAVSRKRRDKPTVSVDQIREGLGQEPVDRGAGPADRMERQERACQVQAGLSRISEEHRAILVLREVDGCAYEEIAEILGLPVGTIRSRLHRARMQLKEQLKGVFQEDVT
jgi:RNA polymerase sigma-70 factor (ECF subfamily)